MDNIKTLKIYQERCFINSLLYQQSMDFNMFLRNIINIPLILISGILTILNSIMDEKDMKIINIVLNGTVGLILGIMNHFKINDKIAIIYFEYSIVSYRFYHLYSIIDTWSVCFDLLTSY